MNKNITHQENQMKSEKILDRIKNVYQESTRFYHPRNEQKDENKAINTENKSQNQSMHNSYVTEIDGNYLLFFNEIYTSIFSKWLKNILKKLAWPILKRQVYFNSVIRQVLYNLMQKSYEDSVRDREINEKLAQIEQQLQQLPQLEEKIGRLPQLEQQLQQLPQLEEKIKRLPQLEQQLQQLPQLEEKIGRLPQLEQQLQQLPQLEEKLEQISIELHADNSVISKCTSGEEAKMKSGLWFNDPIWVGYRDTGEAYWVETTERILEKTFVMHSLAHLYESKNIEILDVGSAESLLSYELASFNYSVTAIDIRPIALFHPNLKFVKTDICKPVLPPASFDCVIALSTLEHIGLGWYGDEQGESYDVEAVKQIKLLLKSNGHFIITVPYGKKALTPVHRIYDKEALQKLIQDFLLIKISYGIRKDDFTWTITENELEASLKEHNSTNYLPGAVAMLVCKNN
jgi:SAM-dependent methyltransferase